MTWENEQDRLDWAAAKLSGVIQDYPKEKMSTGYTQGWTVRGYRGWWATAKAALACYRGDSQWEKLKIK